MDDRACAPMGKEETPRKTGPGTNGPQQRCEFGFNQRTMTDRTPKIASEDEL
jgi:hypothetical protein